LNSTLNVTFRLDEFSNNFTITFTIIKGHRAWVL
jgi:hypothetical protein